MGRYLIRVHIARCSGNRDHISETDEIMAILEKAIDIEPRLCYYGIGVYEGGQLVYKGRKFDDSRDKLQNAIEELIACENWLVSQFRTKAIRRDCSSYRLKHIVEHSKKRYISNGALCAMAIGMGFKYVVDGPNIYINVSKELHDYDGTPVA